ncbi:hypothetical protein QAA18_04020 [Luteimonas sp. 8-5]|uniref:CshA/CshB family fibrillar adhesin-related protein n=1 Tax=Luteimonas sp. 8-5 TaxID=3039387 RepID=UPI0024363C60|nr:CshA/CshB family fibrillar adhesin-related protein [Luteimonas sp. 8-5]MDG6347909.1 hypothetical protein [Luteimonas sp. 8-5]
MVDAIRRVFRQGFLALGLVLAAWLLPGLVQVASAQTATVCHPADVKGTDGPIDFGAYCWIDFSPLNLTQAKSTSGQNFRVNLRGGAYLTFTLRIIPGNTAGANMYARPVPSWTGAAFGNSAFNDIPGNPILYQDANNQNNPRDTVRLTSITLHANGSTELPFVFVAADGESSNNGESITFTTTGTAWDLVSAPGISNPTRNMPVLTPATAVGNSTGSKTVDIDGVAAGSGGGVGSYVFTTDNSPGTVTAELEGSGLQGVLFGLKYHTIGLSLTKTHVGDFTVGGTGTYTINVANTVVQPQVNPPSTPQPVRVVDTLPAGLTYASAGGTGWTCSNVGQVVTCDTVSLQDLTYTRAFPPLSINVTVDSDATSPLVNSAVVSNPTTTTLVYNVCETEDNGVCPNSATNTTGDETVVLRSDLSTSTKTVVNLGGGDPEPGDTLRYTITVRESAGVAATGVTVTDDMPAGISGFTVVGTPAGSTHSSSPTGGANGAGVLNVTGIDVPANGSVSIIFDATISAGAAPGLAITNVANVANPRGTGAAPGAMTTVAAPQLPAEGNKLLYIYNGTGPSTRVMTRTPQPAAGTAITINRNDFAEWRLQPALQKDLTIKAGSVVSVSLNVECVDTTWLIFWTVCASGSDLRWRADLYTSGGSHLGTSGDGTFNDLSYALRGVNIPFASATTIPAGQELILRITNTSGANRPMRMVQRNGAIMSTVSMDVSTVINVDSVLPYSAAYGSTATATGYAPGQTVHLRAVVSDPFGYADISGANIVIEDATGTTRVGSTPMTPKAGSGAQRIYEYAYTIPAASPPGPWTAKVTAREGTEGTVSHMRSGSFMIAGKVTLGNAWGAGATAGDAVSLSISGGVAATPGSSTAPATTSPATAYAGGGTPVTLAEAFTVGVPGIYTVQLSCVIEGTTTPVAIAGTGLTRVITMPAAASVICTWDNSKTVPLTVVKLSTVVSDPVNGTTNPKAIPGAIVEYQIIVTNPAANATDADSVFVTDAIPQQLELWVGDIGWPGPVRFDDGTPASGLSFGAGDVAFSNDGGSTWTYSPSGSTTDPAVDAIRINPKGAFDANNAQFTVRFRARIK